MQVSFIIPLYNCLQLTQSMLGSLRATIPANLEYEIIFVDDGSTDGTREWLETLQEPMHKLLNEKNCGFAITCNRGAKIAQGEFLFFLNNDLYFMDRWLEPMLAPLYERRDSGLVGNVQINALTGKVDHSGIFFNHQGKPQHLTLIPLVARWNAHSANRRVDALTGACFGISRKNWILLGGFDEGFINGSEDVDLCLRAASMGFSNYVALRSQVRHHISASTGRKLRDEQNAWRLVQRWRPQIIPLMTRDWCRHQIVIHADQSGLLDYDMLQEALLYLGGAAQPGPHVRAGVELALLKEEQRWREILESTPPPIIASAERTDHI